MLGHLLSDNCQATYIALKERVGMSGMAQDGTRGKVNFAKKNECTYIYAVNTLPNVISAPAVSGVLLYESICK